jgi:hypothetical protein
VIFNNQISERSAQKKLEGCHVEICQHLQKSIEYCVKGPITERGTPPVSKGAMAQ